MSCPARKLTLWPLRNVSTQINLCSPRRLIPETENPQEAKSVYPVSLRGMLRLIRVDTLRIIHNVGFLAGQLK